jgi:hypothetical protein
MRHFTLVVGTFINQSIFIIMKKGTVTSIEVEKNGEYALFKNENTEDAAKFFKALSSEIEIKGKIFNFLKYIAITNTILLILSAILLLLLVWKIFI